MAEPSFHDGSGLEVLSKLVESVTIYPDEPSGAEAEVVAKVAELISIAQTTTPPRGAAIVVQWFWLRGQDDFAPTAQFNKLKLDAIFEGGP